MLTLYGRNCVSEDQPKLSLLLLRVADASYSLAAVAYSTHAKKGNSRCVLDVLEAAELVDRATELDTALYYLEQCQAWLDVDDDLDE